MLISRQGVGGDRAHTHGFFRGERTSPCVVISGYLPGGAFSSAPTRCETTFDSPNTVAQFDKEVAS